MPLPEPIAKFWISGPPAGRRLQVVRFGGHSSIGHTTVSEKYLRRIRAKIRHEWGDALPLVTPVAVILDIAVPIPDSWSLKKKRAHDMKPAPRKPDVDNVMKLALDGLVGTKNDRIVLNDDTLVVKLFVERRYAWRDACGLGITVLPVDGVTLRA